MCTGIHKDYLILRIGKINAQLLANNKYVSDMDITGKPMKGWVKIAPDGIQNDTTLENYIKLAIEFVSTLPNK